MYRPKEKNFFSTLFNLDFSSSLTLKYITFVYFLVIFGAVVWLIFGWLVRGFIHLTGMNPEIGLVWLLLGWIPPVFALVLSRITLEFFVATSQTSRDTASALAVLERMETKKDS